MISADNRPLWENLINETRFVETYFNQHEKIVNNTASLIVRLEQWFDLIESTVLEPYHLTDPYASVGWYPQIQVPYGWFYIDKSRVLNFIENRAQFVIGQLP